jgi:hypothetical protein
LNPEDRGHVKKAAWRLAITPFETAVALLLVSTAAASIAHVGIFDPVDALLPKPEAFGLNVWSILTGILMIMGAAAGSRGPEIAGLLFLIGVVVNRFILYGYYLGFGINFMVTGIFYSAVVGAALVRLHTLRTHRVLIMLRNGRDSDAGG